MANIKSAAKQARMSVRRRVHNKARVSKFRSLEKQIRALVVKSDKDGAKKLLAQFQSALDKAAKAHTVHRNTASRKKSRLAKLLK
jgi:small subunit ribosomal protein S20